MNKKTTPEKYLKAIELSNEVELGFAGNFIFGDPAETGETVRETMEFFFANCLDKNVFIDFIKPYPGSKIFDYCLESGLIPDKLEYYETIDERWVNMTKMENEGWHGDAKLLETIFNTHLWEKSTEATSYEEDPETNPILEHSKMILFKLWANCPHCRGGVFYRLMGTKDAPNFFMPTCTHCHKKMRIKL